MAERFLGFDRFAGDAYRERLLRKAGLDRPAPRKGLRALDLGCGHGEVAAYLAQRGWQVDAVDIEASPEWKGLAKRARGSIRFSVGDAQALKKPAASYDLVMEKDMAHHAADPVKAFAELRRVAKPGAQVLVIEGNRLNPIFYVHLTLMEGHEHFTLWTLRRLLDEAGMPGARIDRVEARVWPFNRAWAQAVMEKVQDGVEWLFFLRPLVCYHVAHWRKPANAKKRKS